MGARSIVAAVPFYRQRLGADGLPRPWTLADLCDYAAETGDPAAGRIPPGARPALHLQLEGSEDVVIYLPLGRAELRGWARALAYAWRLWGVGAGDVVALYDYGSSPAVFLASGLYVPGLGRGRPTCYGRRWSATMGRRPWPRAWPRPCAAVARGGSSCGPM